MRKRAHHTGTEVRCREVFEQTVVRDRVVVLPVVPLVGEQGRLSPPSSYIPLPSRHESFGPLLKLLLTLVAAHSVDRVMARARIVLPTPSLSMPLCATELEASGEGVVPSVVPSVV
eukprot:SAG31_NODE_4778_length_2959_cov_17.543706_2_plen_116_part_00